MIPAKARGGAAVKLPPDERFFSRVEKTSTCWYWTGSLDNRGYGSFVFQNRKTCAHRWAYEHLVGPIPAGLELDHLCRTPRCVNPDHLEPVTHAENLRRGNSPSAIACRTNRCQRGHEFTPENTIHRWDGKRRCRECENAGQRRRSAAQKSEELS